MESYLRFLVEIGEGLRVGHLGPVDLLVALDDRRPDVLVVLLEGEADLDAVLDVPGGDVLLDGVLEVAVHDKFAGAFVADGDRVTGHLDIKLKTIINAQRSLHLSLSSRP